ncbi:MAG TPA: hypothetical protein VHQ89_12035 [Gaiellaceae bacterium]|nr:hypothetical protein [Gaiellaceae bacterium]
MLALLAATATVFTGCTHQPSVRPASVVFACGDGNFYATTLHWSNWSATAASAKGVGHANDCRPYCAAGHFHAYPLAVRLSRPVQCVHGRTEFSRIAWTYTGGRPAHVPRTGDEMLPCSFLRLKP